MDSRSTLVPLQSPAGRSRWTIRHDGRTFVVFIVDGEYRVVDSVCPHRGGPIAEGVLRGDEVMCPWHWYRFDLTTGACLTAREFQLRHYPVVHRDGAVFAEIPPAERARSWSEILRAHAKGTGSTTHREPDSSRGK